MVRTAFTSEKQMTLESSKEDLCYKDEKCYTEISQPPPQHMPAVQEKWLPGEIQLSHHCLRVSVVLSTNKGGGSVIYSWTSNYHKVIQFPKEILSTNSHQSQCPKAPVVINRHFHQSCSQSEPYPDGVR